ncbi:pyridoxamine 5'-phosphate oxidase family protein [Streptomyces physcomitrii]|uniref:Pyridoxamine 5'-phosphate oxidase family protein n=1 Tax=Streptomyces physcomitrii TaxID=2724184 RepID=A0ABX1H070_9ACTN|nr:pyridoxamine 5'-phosphate oxidase family protein [Streptomyces physcomitrii]NKI41422.1 pyridoxamine 5'-phosphate oxidase family protein [Streptomyces physcomitrii]
MALSREAREQFLAEPRVAALGVTAGADRGPLLVPVWFGYEPGGRPWILTGADSRKARLIKAAGRFSLLVEDVQPTVRYVSVEGTVAEMTPGTEDTHREIASRYLSGPELERYLGFAQDTLGEQVVIRMRPEHWLGADLGAV